ncbi:U3 snoRNP protein [Sparganum proliferum]
MVYFLHRCMLKDLKGTIDLFVPLLTNKRQHIRTFSSGCIAFFLHKIPTAKLLRLLWELHKSNSSLTSDCGGDILAETLRSVDGQFHSCCREVIPGIMDLAAGNLKESPESPVEQRRHSKRLRHDGAQNSVNDADSLLTTEEAANFCMRCLTRALKLLTDSGLKPESLLATGRLYFSRLSDPNLMPSRAPLFVAGLDSLIMLLFNKRHINQFEGILYELFCNSIAKNPSLPLAELVLKFVNMILSSTKFSESERVGFLASVVRHKSFERDFAVSLPDILLRFSTKQPASLDLLTILARMSLIHRSPQVEPVAPSSTNSLLCLSLASSDTSKSSPSTPGRTTDWLVQSFNDEFNPTCMTSLSRRLCTLLFLKHLRDCLLTRPELSCAFLRILDLCSQAGLLQDTENAVNGVERFLPFLMSFSHQIRLHSLRILRCLLMSMDSYGTGLLSESPLTAIDRCLTCERTKHCPNSLRELLATILHLHCGRAGVFKSSMGAKIVIHYLLGLLHVNLTPVWDGVVAALASFLNPVIYAEAADAGSQPRDYRKRQIARSRSRSPDSTAVAVPDDDEETAESAQAKLQWRQLCKEMFWSKLTELLGEETSASFRPPDEVDSGPSTLVFDELPIESAFLALLYAIPDERSASVLPVNATEAPTTFSPHRRPDWRSYRLNLWRTITPAGVGKHARFLVPIFLKFVNSEFYGCPSKANEDVLICALNLFSQMPNLQSVFKHEELSLTVLRLLTNKRPVVQQAAFKVWLNLSPKGVVPYREDLEKILSLQSFREAVRVFKLDTSVAPKDRAIVAPILIRILYGRLHLSKENLAPAVFTNLADCTDAELGILLSLIIESFYSAVGIPAEGLPVEEASFPPDAACLRASLGANSWARLQAICQVVENLLSFMGHRLGGLSPPSSESSKSPGSTRNPEEHAPTLFQIGLLMIAITSAPSAITDTSGEPKKPHSKQVKVVRKTGLALLLHLFNAPGINTDAFWTPKRVEIVQQVVIRPYLPQLSQAAVASPGHLIICLSLACSQKAHLSANFLTQDLLTELMKLLLHPKVSKHVTRVIIEILWNMIFLPEVQVIGRLAILPHHSSLIEYIYQHMLALCSLGSSQARKTLNSSSEVLQREFKLLGYLTIPLENTEACFLSPDQASRLLSGLLPFLVKTFARKPTTTGLRRRGTEETKLPRLETEAVRTAQAISGENTEAEILRALCRLMEVTSDVSDHLSRVLDLFSKVESRISRTLLCNAAGIAASRLPLPAACDALNTALRDLSLFNANLAKQSPPGIVEAMRAVRTQWGEKKSTAALAAAPAFERNIVFKLLTMVNSWDSSRLDMIDSAQHEAGMNAFTGLCDLLIPAAVDGNDGDSGSTATTTAMVTADSFVFFIHLAGVNCALHILQTAELQLRDLALDYCVRLAETLRRGSTLHKQEKAAASPAESLIKRLIVDSLWPGLCRSIKFCTGPRRLHFFRLLTGLVRALQSHPFFAPLALLADFSNTQTCFFTNLQSGTTARQLFALRRLALFLQNPLTIASKKAIQRCLAVASARKGKSQVTAEAGGCAKEPFVLPLQHLRGIFLPVLLFIVKQELNNEVNSSSGTISSEARPLLTACFDAVRALASHLPWSPYRELLNSALSQLDQAPDSSVALRYALAIIDGFQAPKWSESDNGQSEQLNFMLTVVSRMQAHITPSKSDGAGADAHPKLRSGTYLRTNAVVALVTLLRRLPQGSLSQRLPHLLLRVVDVLRPSRKLPSRARMEAVSALSKVAAMVAGGGNGVQDLDCLFNTVSRELSRGYTAMQIRLASLHRIFGDLAASIEKGDLSIVPGTLDNGCLLLFRLYLDEVAGSLGEQNDSRRDALASFSATSVAEGGLMSSLPVAGTTDLPEAKGFKAPAGVPLLLRFMSPSALERLFSDLRVAAALVAKGLIISNESLSSGGEVTSDQKLINHLRYRKRALARLQTVLNRIPTKQGLLAPRLFGGANHLDAGRLSLKLINTGDNSKADQPPVQAIKRGPAALYRPGWGKAGSQLLEQRPSYLELPPEPTRESQKLHATQTDTAAHESLLLVSCGLQTLLGLLRSGLLQPDREADFQLLADCVPAVMRSLSTSYLAVLAGAVRCVRFFLHVAVRGFALQLPEITSRLFALIDSHAGLLSTGGSARDVVAQSFAQGLYATLAAVIRHQNHCPLSQPQLVTLFNTIETEIVRDAVTAPALALLLSLLHRRLRDPNPNEESAAVVKFHGDNSTAASTEAMLAQGLLVAKATDKDFSFAGAGGGPRLVALMLRVLRMAITSPSELARRDCRRCLLTFLLNYPHQKRFITSLLGFLLRQLEHGVEFGRSSVASLLANIVAELPVENLLQGGLDETILLSVGAAIERESSVSVRLALYGIIRLLFTRLPEANAEAHFNEYLLAFLRASASTRASARLLGLQLVSVVLDTQEALSTANRRNLLLDVIANNIVSDSRTELQLLRSTHAHLFSEVVQSDKPVKSRMDGETPDGNVDDDDDGWMSDLEVPPSPPPLGSKITPYEQEEEEEEEDEGMDEDEAPEDRDEEEDVEDAQDLLAEDPQAELDAMEVSPPEQVTADAVKAVESCIGSTATQTAFKPSRSAPDMHFVLVTCTLEHGLRMIYRLLSPAGEDEVEADLTALITSKAVLPLWQTLLSPPEEKDDERAKKYSKLLMLEEEVGADAEERSLRRRQRRGGGLLLLAPTRPVREWAARCLSLLLRAEVASLGKTMTAGTEPVFRSEFFKSELEKGKNRGRRRLVLLLSGILSDSLRVLELESRNSMPEEYSTVVLANIIQLGQLLHALGSWKSVLRIFKTANRISLDELNNRKYSFAQRILALKLTAGLLLKLPPPSEAEIAAILRNPTDPSSSSPRTGDEEEEVTTSSQSTGSVIYLKTALRLLARESRQRERLAFLATSSVALSGDAVPTGEERNMGRRLSGRLNRVDSTRAKMRRKRTEAKMRRALLSGELSATEASQRLANLPMVELASADHLISLIESTESALASALSARSHQPSLISTLYARNSLSLHRKRDARALRKVAKAALGEHHNTGTTHEPLDDTLEDDAAGGRKVGRGEKSRQQKKRPRSSVESSEPVKKSRLNITTHATASAGTDTLRNPGPVVRANSMGAGLLNRGRTLGIGCWNVRTFLDPGAQSLTAHSPGQYNVDVCCLSEVRLPDSGSREIKIPGVESHFTLYRSGSRDSSGRHGVAIALSQQLDLALLAWEPVNDRMSYVRLKGHFTNISIISVRGDEVVLDDWGLGILVPILKKGDKTRCENYRGIGLNDVVAKIFAIVLLRRFQAVRDSRTRPNQAGFRAGRGCADHIFTLMRILEFRYSYQQPTAVCFIDFAAAFDSVHRESLWRIMALDGVPAEIIAMTKAYYRSTTARVLVRNNLSQPFGIRSGVRLGCIVSPILFNYAIDWILGRALRESDGVEFAPGHRLTDLDYADDIALLASSFGDLQSMVSWVNEVAKSVGLSINAGKTNVFSSRIPDQEKTPLGIDGCQLEEVRVYRASVRSVLYGCECWAVRVDERKREIFDHQCLRTTLRMKFTDFVSNETVRARCDNIARITQAIQERRLRWFGHVLRRPPQELNVTARDPAPLPHWRRRRGGQFKTWLDTIRQDMEVVLGPSVFGLRRWRRE